MTLLDSPLVDTTATVYRSSPRYEGANIRTWIGFKHFMFLVEEAVLRYFRERDLGARDLFHSYGLGLEIVDFSAQLPHTLQVDDDVEVVVRSAERQKPGAGLALVCEILIPSAENAVALKGKLKVALIREADAVDPAPVPPELEEYTFDSVDDVAGNHADIALEGRSVEEALASTDPNAYLWSWRAPYYYCHFSDRVQHSAYTRAMEEVVDRFLHDRGLQIGRMLKERAWIPVVSRARVRLVADAHMEETVHTVFTVQDILKDISYTATMNCYVQRDDTLVQVMTGTIMHGYAVSRGESAGSLAEFDSEVVAALQGAAS